MFRQSMDMKIFCFCLDLPKLLSCERLRMLLNFEVDIPNLALVTKLSS